MKIATDEQWNISYEEWTDFETPNTNNISQDIMRVAISGSLGEDAVVMPDGVYLKIGYRADTGRLDTGYSLDGHTFKDLVSNLTTHPLGTGVTKMGIGVNTNTTEQHDGMFRFFRVNQIDSGNNGFFRSAPVYGRRIPVSGTEVSSIIPDPLVLASGIFSDSLTVSGIPVATGTDFSVTRTFFTAPTSGAAATVLNTVIVTEGSVSSWTQV